MERVEEQTWMALRGTVLHVDPHRVGWCVDAGVGEDNYYFTWFQRLGFESLAIEPVPTASAREQARLSGVDMIESALGAASGMAEMHHFPDRPLHTLNADFIGASDAVTTVPVVTLADVLDLYGIDFVNALKLDIEGAELDVLAQIPALPPERRPLVVAFEFGGVYEAWTERGPWSPERVARLFERLTVLYALGYTAGACFATAQQHVTKPIPFDDLVTLLEPTMGYGMLVLAQNIDYTVTSDQLIQWGEMTPTFEAT